VIGFAEGVEVIFVSTYEGMFTVELKSGKVKKIVVDPITGINLLIYDVTP